MRIFMGTTKRFFSAILFFCCACVFYFYTSISSKHVYSVLQKTPAQKVLIVSGELSGDRISAWYTRVLKNKFPKSTCHTTGNMLLTKQEATRDITFDNFLRANTLESVLKKILIFPLHVYRINKFANYIVQQNFDHVVLVDLPIVNVLLARQIKIKNPEIHVTYIAPPELWFWGRWKIDSLLKKYCDEIIVLYPFEQRWYKNIGLNVTWLGYPFYQEFYDYLAREPQKTNTIALLPGSRKKEPQTMLPIFAEFVKNFRKKHPDVRFILPLAESFSLEKIKELLKTHAILEHVKIIVGTQAKKQALSECCLAITKPGTITLDLALLKTPSIVAYKVSWPLYYFIKLIASPEYISLANRFASEQVSPELLQTECTPDKILNEALILYESFVNNTKLYHTKLKQLDEIRYMFARAKNIV